VTNSKALDAGDRLTMVCSRRLGAVDTKDAGLRCIAKARALQGTVA
jgi:hypothetical protein